MSSGVNRSCALGDEFRVCVSLTRAQTFVCRRAVQGGVRPGLCRPPVRDPAGSGMLPSFGYAVGIENGPGEGDEARRQRDHEANAERLNDAHERDLLRGSRSWQRAAAFAPSKRRMRRLNKR